MQKVGDFSGNLEIWLVSILNFVQHETGSQNDFSLKENTDFDGDGR